MKIAVLVSGGVDSSVAFHLLYQQGVHELHAFYLKIWLEDEMSYLGECPWEEDLRYVRELCAQLNVPLTVISLQREYHDRVMRESLEEIRHGRTPNPDILCNSLVKFGAFLDAIDTTFDRVATGHYATMQEQSGRTVLSISPDPIKDQTYFLARLTNAQVERAMFPVGLYNKRHIRQLADMFNVPAKHRPDSQGLCFLGKIRYQDFVRHHLGTRSGEIIERETGNVLGTHDGYWFATIGQRKGLNLPGGPWYVVSKDIDHNRIFVSHRLSMHREGRDTFPVDRLHWIAGVAPAVNVLRVKLRHGPAIHKCILDIRENNTAVVHMISHKDRGIAPGQYAVFYDGDVCLGCGIVANN